ncbi:MAG: TetR/AcrR family transcriptional regulator [Atopobiaceae bacterium]
MAEAGEQSKHDAASAVTATVTGAIEVHEAIQKKIASQKKQLKTAGSRMKTRKSTRTRQRIIDAAKEIIDEKGTTNFQMSEVAARCNMSKGALYYYFKDRSQIVSIVNQEIGQGIISAVEDISTHESSAVDALQDICESFAIALSGNRAGFAALLGEFMHRGYDSVDNMNDRYAKLVELTASLVERGKKEGAVDPEVNTSLVANSLIGMFMFAAASYLGEEDAMDTSEFSSQLMGIVLEGIGTKHCKQES